MGGRSNSARMSKVKSEKFPDFPIVLSGKSQNVAEFCSTRGTAAPATPSPTPMCRMMLLFILLSYSI